MKYNVKTKINHYTYVDIGYFGYNIDRTVIEPRYVYRKLTMNRTYMQSDQSLQHCLWIISLEMCKRINIWAVPWENQQCNCVKFSLSMPPRLIWADTFRLLWMFYFRSHYSIPLSYGLCRPRLACADCACWSVSVHYAEAIMLVFSWNGSYWLTPVKYKLAHDKNRHNWCH